MRIDIYLHDEREDSQTQKLLLQILNKLQIIETKEIQMAGELDALTAEVSANTDAEASAVILLGKLHDLIVAAGTDPAKLTALTQQLAASKDALAQAIVANTPAA